MLSYFCKDNLLYPIGDTEFERQEWDLKASCCRKEGWSPERWSNLPNISSRARAKTRVLSLICHPSHPAVPGSQSTTNVFPAQQSPRTLLKEQIGAPLAHLLATHYNTAYVFAHIQTLEMGFLFYHLNELPYFPVNLHKLTSLFSCSQLGASERMR